MLGIEHKTSRGSIVVEYYGRNVGIKILPTGKYKKFMFQTFRLPIFSYAWYCV